MAAREQDTGLEPQRPTARRELGLLPASAEDWRSGPPSSGEADRLPSLCPLLKETGRKWALRLLPRTQTHHEATALTSPPPKSPASCSITWGLKFST